MPEVLVVMKIAESNTWKPGMVVEIRRQGDANYPALTATSEEILGTEGKKLFLPFFANLTENQITNWLEPFVWETQTTGPVFDVNVIEVENARGFTATGGELGNNIRIRGLAQGDVERTQNLVVTAVDQGLNQLTLSANIAHNFIQPAQVIALMPDLTRPKRRNRRQWRRVRVANLLTAGELADATDKTVASPVMDWRSVSTAQWAARSVTSRTAISTGDGDFVTRD